MAEKHVVRIETVDQSGCRGMEGEAEADAQRRRAGRRKLKLPSQL
jgi:hypothetical protein